MITLAEITLAADVACGGMYIRWYFNGWHYAIARLGEESLTTSGGYATSLARGALKLETEQGDALDTYALQSMAYAPSLQVYTSEGWTNATLDSGRFRTYEEGVDKLRHELSITLFGRRGGYSPVTPPEPEPPAQSLGMGYLYNAAALTDLAAAGWRVPTKTDYDDLIAYVGINSALKLMITGTTYWLSGIGTDSYGFAMKGAGGIISGDGSSQFLKGTAALRTQTDGFFGKTSFHFMAEGGIYDLVSDFRQEDNLAGYSVRLIKNSTTLSHGQTSTYLGNDGKSYPTICIGTQEWLAANLKETKYLTGVSITKCTDNEANWPTLSAAGGLYAAYNNDENIA